MIIKLGLEGSEIDLEQSSLTLPSVNLNTDSSTATSADGTLHIDYRPVKRTFNLNYDVVLKSYYDTLQGLYELQVDNLTNLNYIIEEDSGLKAYTVQMSPVSKGADLRDKPYYTNVSIQLVEV